MKKTIILILILMIKSINAYIDCTPDPCDYPYTDNGVYCQDGECIRNCTGYFCDDSWQEVHSSICNLIGTSSELKCEVGSYTPTDTSKCYKFNVEAAIVEVKMNVVNPPDPDCDSFAWGGFYDPNRWYKNLDNYLGYVNSNNFNYKLEGIYAHSEGYEDSDVDPNTYYVTQVRTPYNIYCAPNINSCNDIGQYSNDCDTNCYGYTTKGFFFQGYEEDFPSSNDREDFFHNVGCNDIYMNEQKMWENYFRVYEANAITTNQNKICYKQNEAPTVSNVKIIPESPDAGKDLICNYTYNDLENFSEQNSSYEWWKNDVNQNINSKVLGKGNLTLGDSWNCSVTPSDGLVFGNKASSEAVVIQSTVQNPKMYIGNNLVWEKEGYFSDNENIIDFNQELQNELDNCVPDAEGNCEITLNFSSDDVGNLYLSSLRVYYEVNISDSYNLSLVQGWNLISLPLSPQNTSVTEVFSLIEGNYSSIFAYNSSDVGNEWKSYDPIRPDFLNTLKEVDETMGIWIKMINPDIITINGILKTNIQFILKQGWNLIGYPTLTTQSVKTALQNVSGEYSSVFMYNASDIGNEWKSYDPARPDFLNTLKNFTPGYGYWVKAVNDTNWSFENNQYKK